MNEFNDFLANLNNDNQRNKLIDVFDWIDMTFLKLEKRISYGQPTYTDHGTFIISFAAFKHYIYINSEMVVVDAFETLIKNLGYELGKGIIKVKNDLQIDFELLRRIINKQVEEKKDCQKFWRT